MELPFEKTVCRYWKQKLYTLLKTEETQELKIPESMPDVGRIISSWAQVILRGKEWRDREIGVSGGIMVWILYSPEDGGALQHLESWIPFQIRTALPDSSGDGVIRAETFVQGLDARTVSSRRIMLRAGAGVLVQALEPEEVEIPTPGNLPEDLELRKETYPFVLTREAGEKSFLIDEEVTLTTGLPKPEQLVYYRMAPEILEEKVLGSKAAFRGMGNLHVLYIDTDGRLTGTDFQVPFAQYVELNGEYESDAQVSNLLCVTSLELDLEPEGVLRLRCGMVSQHLVNAMEPMELLEDCYSVCREVQLEKELLSVPSWLDHQNKTITLTAAMLSEGDSCVDMIFTPAAPGVSKRNGMVQVEVSGTFQGVTMDRTGGYASIHDKAAESIRMETECETVSHIQQQGTASCRPEAGSWRTDTRVLVDLRSLCTKPVELVSGITAGETGTPDPERPSVIIRTKGNCESLWDLAKKCGSTVGAIKRLNKLDGEPEEERLLLIPVL